jgi:hypothetical protein
MHFYTIDGESAHTQNTKAGAKNPTRPTTIADARKLGLLPSVTTIFDVINKPFLTEWKVREALKMAYANPASPFIDRDSWVNKIKAQSEEQVGGAAELGTAVHNCIETSLDYSGSDESKARMFSFTEQVLELAAPAVEYVRLMGIVDMEREQVACSSLGYAGTIDISGYVDGMPIIVDFKTKKTREGEDIEVPETYPWQLAAYHFAEFGLNGEIHPHAKAINIYISTTEKGRMEIVTYERAELVEAFECFKACFKLWSLKNKYSPRAK